MKPSVQDLVAASVACCAITVTALVVHREMLSSPPHVVTRASQELPQYREMGQGGTVLGGIGQSVQVLVFSDFQCPYCREFAVLLDTLLANYGNELTVVYRHLPLTAVHDQAFDAAVAAECAAKQGRFRSFHDLLFREQGVGARLDLAKIAEAAGLRLEEFEQCQGLPEVRLRVHRDSILAGRLQIAGTPTYFLNQQRFAGVPTYDDLRALVEALLP